MQMLCIMSKKRDGVVCQIYYFTIELQGCQEFQSGQGKIHSRSAHNRAGFNKQYLCMPFCGLRSLKRKEKL